MSTSPDSDTNAATIDEAVRSIRECENAIRNGLGRNRVTGRALTLLTSAHRAATAAAGLSELLRVNRMAASIAGDSEVPFHGINDYHASAIEDAIELILRGLVDGIESFARESGKGDNA